MPGGRIPVVLWREVIVTLWYEKNNRECPKIRDYLGVGKKGDLREPLSPRVLEATLVLLFAEPKTFTALSTEKATRSEEAFKL